MEAYSKHPLVSPFSTILRDISHIVNSNETANEVVNATVSATANATVKSLKVSYTTIARNLAWLRKYEANPSY